MTVAHWLRDRGTETKNNFDCVTTVRDKELVKTLDYSGVTFPVSIKDMDKIERQNKININVFGFKGETYTIRVSKEKYSDHLELLLIIEGGEDTITLSKEKKLNQINSITSTSKISTDLCTIFPRWKPKNTFVCIVCNVSILLST